MGFLSCFMSTISDRFIPYNIQVHHNHPVASIQAYASNILSGSVGCFRPTTDSETLRKYHKWVFCFVRSELGKKYECVHTADYAPHVLKRPFVLFSQSVRVSGPPQKAYQSPKAHCRRQLLWMPLGDCGGPGCCGG